jgi:sirohydrochlorin ferrochelatase
MTSESILLIGREAGNARDVYEAHARRLDRRTGVDEVEIATYETEPVRELRDRFGRVTADRVFAVPMAAAHTHHTVDGVPAALSYVSGSVRYCEPLAGSRAVTDVIEQRGAELAPATSDVSLVLVGFGSSSLPYSRQMVDAHADRLREESGYGEVVTCYLLQNPAVECVRYNVTNERVVAVPLFLSRTEATEERIPDELELDRGNIAYADPLGSHPRVTDALCDEIDRQRALALGEGVTAFEGALARAKRPVATDGEGRPRS